MNIDIKIIILRFVKSLREFLKNPFKFIRYFFINHHSAYQHASPSWFVAVEKKYGGIQYLVKRGIVSPLDQRSKYEIDKGGMQGGDRMYHHSYAEIYSHYLKPFLLNTTNPITLIEVGILNGSGLAIWSDLLPNADIIGLDIDLTNTQQNLDFLKTRGAFKNNLPELYKFDQLNCDQSHLRPILRSRKIDICIDDGLHSDESIINTLNAMLLDLSDNFVYFIEDHKTISSVLVGKYPQFKIIAHGEMTVIVPKNYSRDIYV